MILSYPNEKAKPFMISNSMPSNKKFDQATNGMHPVIPCERSQEGARANNINDY